MYGGINLHHFTGGSCAELVALGHARASGARELTTIVAVGNFGRGPIGPCGRDRQVLFDHHPNIRVILPTLAGVKSTTLHRGPGDSRPPAPPARLGTHRRPARQPMNAWNRWRIAFPLTA
jgi:hypothetical protein